MQLSGPQIGTAGTALARCPPPSRVCLRERKPAHLWNPSLSPRSPLPPVPWERGVSRPHSGALFPLPRSDYNAGSVPSAPPPPAKRPLWWGVAQPHAPGHLLQLDLHKVPTRGALGDSPEAEGQVPLGLLWSQRPKPAEGPCGAWLSGAHPLYRGGGGAGNSDLELPSQTSPVKLPLLCMILTEALSPRPAAEPLDTCGPWDPPTHSLAPDPLLGPYQCLRAFEGQRSKSAPTKGGPLLPGPQIPKTPPPPPLSRERGRPHVRRWRWLPETPQVAGTAYGPPRVPNTHSELHDTAATSKIPLRGLAQSLQRQPCLVPTLQPGRQLLFRQDLPPIHLAASPQLLGPCLQSEGNPTPFCPCRDPQLGLLPPRKQAPGGHMAGQASIAPVSRPEKGGL